MTSGPSFPSSWRERSAWTSGTCSKDSFCATVGVCNVMGTANTMAVVAEVLGMALPGSAVVPAAQSRRSDLGERTGVRAVELARPGVTPSRLLTEAAFENALRVLVAIGGSTNGVIHLEAIAGRLGIPLGLDRLQRISERRHGSSVSDPRASSRWTTSTMLAVSPPCCECWPRCWTEDATMGDGRTLADVAETAGGRPNGCLRSLDDPFEADGGLVVLRGSLAPGGSIFKRSAAPSRCGPTEVRPLCSTIHLPRSSDPSTRACTPRPTP